MKRLLVVALIAACNSDVDEVWELDHDRLIAVRASAPGIASGETSTLDALLGVAGDVPREVQVESSAVITPTSLASALSGNTVTAPSEAELAAARTELGLAADADVPLQMRLFFVGTDKVGLKTVLLGTHADNPAITSARVGGEEAVASTNLTVPAEQDVRLDIDFPVPYRVNWLTSCGTMHDYDLANAYLRVEPEDPQAGTLGVVVRDETGGVTWHLWPITAD